jgi:hypothetical protein
MSRSSGRGPQLVEILGRSERVIYYGAAVALIITVGLIFASVVVSVVDALSSEPLEAAFVDTSPTVLDRGCS